MFASSVSLFVTIVLTMISRRVLNVLITFKTASRLVESMFVGSSILLDRFAIAIFDAVSEVRPNSELKGYGYMPLYYF